MSAKSVLCLLCVREICVHPLRDCRLYRTTIMYVCVCVLCVCVCVCVYVCVMVLFAIVHRCFICTCMSVYVGTHRRMAAGLGYQRRGYSEEREVDFETEVRR